MLLGALRFANTPYIYIYFISPSIIPISSSLNPYNSYTIWLISFSNSLVSAELSSDFLAKIWLTRVSIVSCVLLSASFIGSFSTYEILICGKISPPWEFVF
jgi:hypothetical protein